MDCSAPGFIVLHNLLEFAQTQVHWVGDAIQPSHHLSLPSPPAPQSFPASGSSPVSWFFSSGGQSIGVSSSASVLQWIVRVDFLYDRLVWSLCSPKDSQNFLQHHNSKTSILRHSAFVMVQLQHLYLTTGKTIALTMWAFVSKVMYLLFLKNFILFLNFTILYWFCQISKWIHHRYTCVPYPEPSSLLPPHTIPLSRFVITLLPRNKWLFISLL